MADPLSIAVGTLAIATAAAQISKAISRLRTFGEVPRRVYAIKNEVSDLEVVLRQLAHEQQQQLFVPEADREELRQLLDRGKERLTELATGLKRIAAACTGDKATIISKTRVWAKEKDLFQRLEEDIQAVKASLSLMVGVSTSHSLHHILLELRQVSIMTATNSNGTQEDHAANFTKSLEDHHSALSTRMDRQYDGLNARLDALGRFVLGGQPQVLDSPNESLPLYSEVLGDASKAEAVRVLIAHRVPCRSWCPCSCHTKGRTKMTVPGFVESVLGTMFISYRGVPVLNKPCDFRGCRDQQNSAATIEYWFPWWLLKKSVKLQFKYLPNVGPQLQLETTRRVPDTALSIDYAIKGNIDGLKYLFAEGLASPRDISHSRGFTLLRWALYGGLHQYDTVKFLLSQGARVDDESYDHLWDFDFRGKCSQVEQQQLRCITEGGDRDWVEEQNFPLIHRIIFGKSSKFLATEIEENPNAIYLEDAQGRTALDWATARAQLDDMEFLISKGADVNSMDITGRTTVLHAVDSHSDEALRIILEAGGDPNPKMPKGLFRSSPLTSSGFGGLAGMLRLLLRYGADTDACNPEGRTALHSVAGTQNVDCTLILLDWGADMNAVSSNGQTPLTAAIINNNHAVLELFMERYYEYLSPVHVKGPQLLPIIAGHADVETMNILASSRPLKLSLDLTEDGLAASHAILRARRDHEEKLSVSFEELVAIAQVEETEAGSDSAVESGLFFSAKTSFDSDLADAIAHLQRFGDSSTEGSEVAEEEVWTLEGDITERQL